MRACCWCAWDPYLETHRCVPCRRSYTAFIPLYPVGLAAEMWAVRGALPAIQSRGLRSVALPNPFNFGFDYHMFLVVRASAALPSAAECSDCCCSSSDAILLPAGPTASLRFPHPAPPLPPPPQVLMCVYPLLWLKLYAFLIRQRRVKLQPAAAGQKRQ